MTELQEKVLELLKEIDALCKANGIEFFLAAGSALGAVRHHGFIPWDDDADICMTSENWKKFYALSEAGGLPEGRKLVHVEKNYKSGYVINRYVDVTTMRLYRYLCSNPQPAGIIVDILVLDLVPDEPEAIQDYLVNLADYSSILTKATSISQRFPYDTHFRKNYLTGRVVGRRRVLDRLKEASLKYDGTREGVYIQRDPLVPHIWKQEVYGTPQYVPFEDTLMPIPAKPYEHLSIAFDEDWMYVPGNLERENHIKSISLTISNNNAIRDYRRHIDKKAINRAYVRRQTFNNLAGQVEKKQDWERLKMAAAKIRLSYRRRGMDPGALLAQLERGEYDALSEYFAEYLELQANKGMIGGVSVNSWLRAQEPFYIDLGDDFLYVCLRSFLHGPNLGRANRILKGRELAGESGARVTELRALIDNCKLGCAWMEAGACKEVLELAEPLHRKYPENLIMMRLYYAARYYLAAADPAAREALGKELAQLPEDDVLSCIRAWIFWQAERRGSALRIYGKLAENSNHGMVLMHIRDTLATVDEDASAYEHAMTVRIAAAEKMGDFIEADALREVLSEYQLSISETEGERA